MFLTPIVNDSGSPVEPRLLERFTRLDDTATSAPAVLTLIGPCVGPLAEATLSHAGGAAQASPTSTSPLQTALRLATVKWLRDEQDELFTVVRIGSNYEWRPLSSLDAEAYTGVVAQAVLDIRDGDLESLPRYGDCLYGDARDAVVILRARMPEAVRSALQAISREVRR